MKLLAALVRVPTPSLWSIVKYLADALLIVTAFFSLSALIVSHRYNVRLNEDLNAKTSEAFPKVGDYVADVPAVALGRENRELFTLSSTHLPAVLYFFAPDCKYCLTERAELDRIADVATKHGYSFIALSTARPNETRKMFPNPFDFPILTESGGGISRSYRVKATPLFIVVNQSKRIMAVRTGLRSAKDIEQSLTE